jgi:hypothetical protein
LKYTPFFYSKTLTNKKRCTKISIPNNRKKGLEKYAVSKLKNKDGSSGEHWNYETTTKVLDSKGYDFHACDWYYVLNMIYSDYYKSGRSDDTYIELAHDFLDDIDAPDDKAKKYYKAMHY